MVMVNAQAAERILMNAAVGKTVRKALDKNGIN